MIATSIGYTWFRLVLCTLLRPSSGSAQVAGFDVVRDAGDVRLRIGAALQDSSIDGKQSGREMLELQGQLYGLSSTDIRRRMDDVIGLVDIGSAIDDRVESYDRVPALRCPVGFAFAGFPYAIALKTGNPAAVNSSVILFFPFAFLTTTFLPKEALTGWLATIATYNPVTYVLAGLRSLITEGWEWTTLGQGLLAIVAVTVVSFGLASAAMRGRVSQSSETVD